jgi:3-dehydroquinate synthase
MMVKPEDIEVRHSAGSYRVRFCTFAEAAELIPKDSFVITDVNLLEHWGEGFKTTWTVLTLSPGEQTKTLSTASEALQWLAAEGCTRDRTLVALGGGVIGDLTGFVASAYMRGIQFIQIPTTVIAMVDSSVGGKVGVDLPQGKNLVGAFHPPEAVLTPLETLGTLAPARFREGLSEVWKLGFVMNRQFVSELERAPLAPDSEELPGIIAKCVELKKAVVEEDELDLTGRRAILNFGHTIGHALETLSGFEMLHGEAVSVGMAIEARIGERIGVTESGTAEQVLGYLRAAGLPVDLDEAFDARSIVEAIRLDKKATRDGVSLSLLSRIGECKLVSGVPESEVEAALRSR